MPLILNSDDSVARSTRRANCMQREASRDSSKESHHAFSERHRQMLRASSCIKSCQTGSKQTSAHAQLGCSLANAFHFSSCSFFKRVYRHFFFLFSSFEKQAFCLCTCDFFSQLPAQLQPPIATLFIQSTSTRVRARKATTTKKEPKERRVTAATKQPLSHPHATTKSTQPIHVRPHATGRRCNAPSTRQSQRWCLAAGAAAPRRDGASNTLRLG